MLHFQLFGFVLLRLIGCLLMSGLLILVVVAFVIVQFGVEEMDNVRAHHVQELSGMRHHHDGVFGLLEVVFEPHHGI